MQIVSEVMTRNVQSISPQETVRRAAQIMDDLNVGALPVCDGDRLIGIVTDRDITVRATSAGLAPDDALINDVMSTDVRWCFEDQPLDEVMQQMADTQIRRVPVMSHNDDHRLVGIVSLGDIATKSADGTPGIGAVVERVSHPSEPDRPAQRSTAGRTSKTMMSNTGTASSLNGSDVQSDEMNIAADVSSTDDPSNLVEVTPDDLVNRNAPGSTIPNSAEARAEMQADQNKGVVVRHVKHGDDDNTADETDASGDIDTAGPSGGVASTAGSAGTNIGVRP